MSWPQAPEHDPVEGKPDLDDPATRNGMKGFLLAMFWPVVVLPLALWLAYDPLTPGEMETLCLEAARHQFAAAPDTEFTFTFSYGDRSNPPRVYAFRSGAQESRKTAVCLVEKRRGQSPSVILEWNRR